MKKLKKIPYFATEKEERAFWQTVDSTQYVDYAKLQPARFPNLKLTSKPITLRLPVSWVERAKIHAHKTDIPYQTLLKQFIAKGLAAL